MNREVHVRFWEGLAVRFRWATQLSDLARRHEGPSRMTNRAKILASGFALMHLPISPCPSRAVSAAERTLPKERGARRGLAEKESWN